MLLAGYPPILSRATCVHVCDVCGEQAALARFAHPDPPLDRSQY